MIEINDHMIYSKAQHSRLHSNTESWSIERDGGNSGNERKAYRIGIEIHLFHPLPLGETIRSHSLSAIVPIG